MILPTCDVSDLFRSFQGVGLIPLARIRSKSVKHFEIRPELAELLHFEESASAEFFFFVSAYGPMSENRYMYLAGSIWSSFYIIHLFYFSCLSNLHSLRSSVDPGHIAGQ